MYELHFLSHSIIPNDPNLILTYTYMILTYLHDLNIFTCKLALSGNSKTKIAVKVLENRIFITCPSPGLHIFSLKQSVNKHDNNLH